MDIIEALRLQLLENGYTPIRNRDKRTFMKNWPSAVITPDEIRSWSRRFKRDTATGIRVEDGLAVIDIDVDDKDTVDAIADAIIDAVPQLGDPDVPLLVRAGKGAKEAWFVGTDELFSRVHSRSWVAPGANLDEGAHRVECFGGASPRQFGSFGSHTITDDGVVEIEYRWVEHSPADTLKRELPVLTKKDFFAAMDAAESVLRERGWEPVALSQRGESDAVRVYDLTPEMEFDLNTGETVKLAELRTRAQDEDDLRCSASWLEGSSSKNRTRCLVSLTRQGHVAIWESASGITHVEQSAKPHDYDIEIDRVAEKLRELDERRRNKITVGDGAVVAAAKMCATYAFCMQQPQTPVVPLWASTIGDGLSLTAFRLHHLPNCDEEIGPRGGIKKINPVDLWMSSDRRVSVAGMQLRPDRERPTFEEGGKTYVNVYSPPAHDVEGGDPKPGIDFMKQLVPDDRERTWFLQWLSFKFRYPHIPGPGVVMVAHKRFGTGRGTFAKLAAKLFGPDYVREMSYSIVAGKSYQSQYTDWGADALLVVVNESSEVENGSAYHTKHNTYERLKELVEPRPTMRTYIAKQKPAFKAMSSTSYLIATNHADALPIPPDDRRFAVLSNGDGQDPDYWERLNAWIDDPAHIAAFAAWLRTIDISSYSPFAAPIETEAKLSMIDDAKSDLDKALELVIENMPADVMVLDQIIAGLRQAEALYGYEYPDRWASVARRMAPRSLHRVGVRDSTNWQLKFEAKRMPVFAKTKEAADHWKTRADLRDEVLVNGSPAASGLPGNVLTGLFKQAK